MYPASVEYLNRQQIIPNWGGGLWEQQYTYIFPFFSFCECVCVCLFVWFCLYSFAFTICPRVLYVCFFFVFKNFFLVQFLVLVIIGGFVFWFSCSLLSFFFFKFFFNNYFYFNNFILFYVILFYFIFFFLSFFLFLLFILSHVDDRLLVFQPGIRAVPVRWESQVQDMGP